MSIHVYIERLVVHAPVDVDDLGRLGADLSAELQRSFAGPARPARSRRRSTVRATESGTPLARAIAASVHDLATSAR